MISNQYILENEDEFSRLEEQGSSQGYRCEEELLGFPIAPGGKILDAGCGSGIVTRFLASSFPEVRVFGIDASSLRVQQAAKAAQHLSNIEFTAGNLKEIHFPSEVFDLIVCRYVLHHMSCEDGIKVLLEYRRCLKPSGHLIIIEPDGIFANLCPQPDLVEKVLKIVNEANMIDLFMGRKLTSLLDTVGFEVTSRKNDVVDFQGELLVQEVKLMDRRLIQVMPILTQLIKKTGFFPDEMDSQQIALDFKDQFLNALKNGYSTYFHNKFVVIAKVKQP